MKGLLAGAAVLALVTAGCGAASVGPATPTASLTVPTTAPVVSSPDGPAPPPTSVPAPVPDWPTYHRDPARTGIDLSAAPISGLSPAWTSKDLDGPVYAEPLIVAWQVLVATEANTVYSFDARTGAEVWRKNLGTPLPRSRLPCGNIDPNGITGTPVADPAAKRLYVVAFLDPGRHELFALDLTTGSVIFHRVIDPPGANPLVHQQRAALALSSGMVYVAFGGLYGDCGQYHGWVVGVPADGAAELRTYQVPTRRMGGIWAPSGPAIAPGGDIYVSTGNGAASDSFDFGDALIRLSPDLKVKDWFAPADWAALNDRDADVGSIGPALLDGDRIFQAGKTGMGYLVRAGRMGHIGGQVFSAPVCNGAYGGTAYAAPVLFVPCRDGLVALRLEAGNTSFSISWRSARFNAGPPIVAGGLVWTIDLDRGVLHGLDMADGAEHVTVSLGPVNHFTTPTAGGGMMFVAGRQQVLAFAASSSGGEKAR